MGVIKSYSELMTLNTFDERFMYASCNTKIGTENFGKYRYLYEQFLMSRAWRLFRNEIIMRDNGCEFGMPDYPILEGIATVHHLNPISVEDLLNESPKLLDPENAITVSSLMHKAVHYSGIELAHSILDPYVVTERTPFDTSPWRHS